MLKYSSLILLVSVAVFWSTANARHISLKHSLAVNSASSYGARHAINSVPSYGARQAAAHYRVHLALAPFKRSPTALAKRETEDSNVEDGSEELGDELAEQILAALLIMSVDDSAEQSILEHKLKEALDRKWNNIDEFGAYVSKVYEEVTGEKLSESSESKI